VLEARGLTKCYAGIPAVDNVSFSIRPGEILGYLGPNGSGKSTTVKMITGLLEPTRGEVLLHGQSIKNDLMAYKSGSVMFLKKPCFILISAAGNTWNLWVRCAAWSAHA